MIDEETRQDVERFFRCGYYTFDQIMEVYHLNREQALEAIKPALDDGNYANFDPREVIKQLWYTSSSSPCSP